MDIIRLYQDRGVDFVTEGHKHSRPGWVNCECPFCTGHQGYHLGWNERDEYFFCWRCGWHPPLKTISEVLKVCFVEAKSLLVAYGINYSSIRKEKNINKEIKPFLFPSGYEELKPAHKKYLEQRGFNADKLAKQWKLLGTGPISRLGEFDYRFRIIFPFYWNGQIVSFDSRDITEKQTNKYMACPGDREKISHKDILYGNQEYWTKTGICVEGPTDVCRLGPQSVATSGIKYTPAQVRVLSQSFKRVAVIFDNESQAQIQAKKLVAELKFRGVEAWNVVVKDDPGSMKQKDADELVNKILKL